MLAIVEVKAEALEGTNEMFLFNTRVITLLVCVLLIRPAISFGQSSSFAQSSSFGKNSSFGQKSLDARHTAKIQTLKSTYRLGFHGKAKNKNGVEVVSVRYNSPATKLVLVSNANQCGALKAGDLITRVDNRQIRTMADYHSAMEASSASEGHVLLSVVDVATGVSREWKAQGDLVRVWGRNAQDSSERLRRVHFIFVGLTDDFYIGEAAAKNLESLRKMASEELVSNRIASITTLQGDECNRDRILREIRDLAMPSMDTLFVHYSGHGAYDPSRAVSADPSGGHFFQIRSGDLMRSTIWESMTKKRARLTVLLTDTCNVESIARLGRGSYSQRGALQRGLSPLEQLLLGHRGSIDISASDRDQYSWYTSDYGGWFTIDACRILRENNDWNAAYRQLRDQTNNTFQRRRREILDNSSARERTKLYLKHQTEMTPRAFVFDVIRDDLALASGDGTERQKTQTFTRFVP